MFQFYEFDYLISNHTAIANSINKLHNPILNDFNEYLTKGYYPFFSFYTEDEYYNIIQNILDKIIYEDIQSIRNMQSSSSYKIKKLIAFFFIQ